MRWWKVLRLAVGLVGVLALSSCGTVQGILDEQDKALYGILPTSKKLQAWTIDTMDIALEQAHISKSYRLTSRNLKAPINLTLTTLNRIERFDLLTSTVLVFQGRYGAENRLAGR